MKQGGNTATILPAADNGLGLADLAGVSRTEEVSDKLEVAREQLLALRRQQEELERQKGDLEELRRKQTEYARGKNEMLENLSRGLAILEREQIETQRIAEQCAKTSQAFGEYLEKLQRINDETWTNENLSGELGRALGTIEHARLEYNRARTKLDCLNPAAVQAAAPPIDPEKQDWQELVRYARLGAAATAPLMLFGTLWCIIWLILR
jgi:DNA repair exonuclease SbcCD ATPase subunit